MKKYLIAFEEVCRGVVEVVAMNEEEARELAYAYEGDMMVHKSSLELGEVVQEENIT
jgi:hypothetical protein